MSQSRIPRYLAFTLCLSAVLACSNFLEPNSDLGLRIYATVSASRISRSDLSASFTIDVCAENRAHHPVIVPTGGPPFHVLGTPRPGNGVLQGYRIANAVDSINAGPAADSWAGTVDTIPSFTANCQTFGPVAMDNWRDGWDVPPGQYRIRSFYNGREGSPAYIRVEP